MAINENGYIRGQIGNIVNRKVGDKNVMQTKPARKTRQTAKTKAAASDFGTASSAGALIRSAFIEAHQELHDSGMHNRLVKQLQRVLRGAGKANTGYLQMRHGNIKRLVNFQFNENCHIHDYVFFDPEITMDESGAVNIQLPAYERHQNLFLPPTATNICLLFDVMAFNFSRKNYTPLGTAEVDLKLYGKERNREEPKLLTIASDGAKYDIVLVTLAVNYLNVQKNRFFMLNNKELNPVAILAAFTY